VARVNFQPLQLQYRKTHAGKTFEKLNRTRDNENPSSFTRSQCASFGRVLAVSKERHKRVSVRVQGEFELRIEPGIAPN
jgi:hypothetical protein